MEEIWIGIKRNLARAYKGIRYNKKQYFSFFIAIFLMQSFFWMLMLTHDAQRAQLKSYANENFDYHLSVSGLNQYQSISLQNGAFTVFLNDRVYEIVRVDSTTDTFGAINQTVYIRFTGDEPAAYLSRFEQKYLNPLLEEADNSSTIVVYHSPLLTLEEDIAALRAPYALLILIFALVATLVLMLLYNIRINHYKFLYGIYMSFGADFKKLLYTAAWELITVSLLTLGPALIAAAAIRLILALALGGRFAVSLWTIPLVFLLNLAVIFASVWLPMRIVSLRAPIGLLAAQDNTNLVTSPRRSFRIYGRRFPDAYEAGSIWRFRRYYAKLLFSSVIFAAISISVLYVGTMYAEHREQAPVPYIISADGISPGFAAELQALDGVLYLNRTYEDATFSSQQDHLLIPTERVRASRAGRYYVRNEVQGSGASSTVMSGYRATNNVSYFPLDEAAIASLEARAASDSSITIEGDLRSALTNPNTVILSDSIYNTQMFTLKPGDTVQLARYTSYSRKIDKNLTRAQDILRQQLKYYNFTYTEYTVGAVLHGLPADSQILFGIPRDSCEALLGKVPKLTQISVSVDPALDEEERTALDAHFNELLRYYNSYHVERTDAYADAALAEKVGVSPLLGVAAGMVLVFFPLVCFFSQILFYYKRSREFSVLLAIGGVDAEIKRLHRLDGALMAIFSFVLTLGLSFLLNYLVYTVCNYWLPSFGFLDLPVRYVFTVSPAMLIVALIVSLGCGYLSCMIPYRLFTERQKKLAAAADALTDAH